MLRVLEGIRLIEVADWGFVPSCATVLADWGADVVKIEHPRTGDPLRGLVTSGLIPGASGINFFMAQVGRNKRSVGIDLSKDEGRSDPLPARREGGRLPHELAAPRARAPEDRLRDDPRPEPAHHLREGPRPRSARPRCGQGRLRRLLVLGAWLGRESALAGGRAADHAAPGVRRLHQRHVHRRRYRGRALPPREDRRRNGSGRLAPRRRVLGDVAGHRRGDDVRLRAAAGDARHGAEPAREQLPVP